MKRTVQETIQLLRSGLAPKGTSNISVLRFAGVAAFDYDFLMKAVNELETCMVMGTPLSPLQQITVHLLFDSACIDLKDYRL